MGSPFLGRVSGRTALGLAVLLSLPTAAFPFSLGDIRVDSRFGEPFQAEVLLTLHPDEDAKGVEAGVADADSYRVLQLSRDLAVSQLKTRLEGKGIRRRLILNSQTPLRVPFFNLLLKTSVGVGSHYRNYPVFLDVSPDHADVQAVVVPRRPADAASDVRRYGPVQAGETLASIARKVRSAPASLNRTMVALWSVNKHRHGFDNMHGLPVGAVLDLPTREQIDRLSDREVSQILEQQQLRVNPTINPPKASVPDVTETTKPLAVVQATPLRHTSLSQDEQGKEGPAKAVPSSLPPSWVEENQRLTASVNKALERVEQLSNTVAEIAQRSLHNENGLATMYSQLADIQARLQAVELKSSQPLAAIPPSISVERSQPAPSPPVVESGLVAWSWFGHAGSVAGGFLLALLPVWLLRRKRERVAREAATSMPGGTSEQPAAPAPTEAQDASCSATSAPAAPGVPERHETHSHPRNALEDPTWQETGRSPVSPPVSMLADSIGDEMADEEESIFKDLLESSPPAPADRRSPLPIQVVKRSAVHPKSGDGVAGQVQTETMEMFEMDGKKG
ncbi:MAG: hypothetical protein H7837_05790 [Magnetococcus sp. MYC-9]